MSFGSGSEILGPGRPMGRQRGSPRPSQKPKPKLLGRPLIQLLGCPLHLKLLVPLLRLKLLGRPLRLELLGRLLKLKQRYRHRHHDLAKPQEARASRRQPSVALMAKGARSAGTRAMGVPVAGDALSAFVFLARG